MFARLHWLYNAAVICFCGPSTRSLRSCCCPTICLFGAEQYTGADRGHDCSETKQTEINQGCVALVQALLLQSECDCKRSDQPSRRLSAVQQVLQQSPGKLPGKLLPTPMEGVVTHSGGARLQELLQSPLLVPFQVMTIFTVLSVLYNIP